MSSDNASSAVTYTTISSDSNGLSWGIPLVNAGKLPKMDPYEEVAQQGQAHLLLPAYVPDPIELDEHVSVYVLEPKHLEYHSPGHIAVSESMEEDSIDYPDEPEDDDEDLGEDPEEDHTDDPVDGEDGDDEPSDDDDDDDDIAGDTEAFETDESIPTPRSPQTRVPFSQTRLCRVQKTVRLEPPMSASMEARIAKHVAEPIPPTNPAYDQTLLGHRAAMIRMRDDILEEDMPPQRRFVLIAPLPVCDVAESSAAAVARPPRSQYDFVDSVEAGQGLIRSPGHNAQTIARAADREEDVGYVRTLQASEHRMMTSIEEVNLRVSYQAQVCRQESEDFYTQLHDARTDRRDIRLEIDVVRGQRTAYETELHEVRQAYLSSEAQNRALLMMRIHVLEARAQIDTVEDTDSSFIIPIRIDIVIISHVHCILVINRIMPVTRQGTNDAMTPESIQAMIDRAIQRNSTHTQDDASQNSGGGPRRPVQPARVCSYTDFMKCQPLNFKGTEGVVGLSQWLKKIELWNDAAYAMTWGTLKKKLTDKYGPKGEIKKLEIELWNLRNCLKLKNRGNRNRNGTTQGRAYALGGRDASPDSNVITVQEYLSKGCDVFLAHITTKEDKYKSEGKRLEDVPIVRDFPKVFPEDLPGIPPARQVEFQIELVQNNKKKVLHYSTGALSVGTIEMKNAEQFKETIDNGFIMPALHLGAPSCSSRRQMDCVLYVACFS
ncbi:hypothetical protein Tco_0240706 [Tanacetum coccineum]